MSSNQHRIEDGKHFRLKDVDPNDTLWLKAEDKPKAKEALTMGVEALAEVAFAAASEEARPILTGVLTRFEGDRLVRIGLVPWGVYGRANSLFTWGWAFGGEFYDAAQGRVTATDPDVVRALGVSIARTRPWSMMANRLQSESASSM